MKICQCYSEWDTITRYVGFVAGVDLAEPGGGGEFISTPFLSTPLLCSARVLHQDVGYENRSGILKVLKKVGERDDTILYTTTSSAELSPGTNAYTRILQ